MNQVKCYKLVRRTGDDKLVSLLPPLCLPPDWPVEYLVGEPAYPHTGELFAFDTEQSARTFKQLLDYHPETTELYEAFAQPPLRPIDSVCCGPSHDFYAFWNHLHLLSTYIFAAPPGTISTRSLTLIKRLS